jgi:hypothetical protein
MTLTLNYAIQLKNLDFNIMDTASIEEPCEYPEPHIDCHIFKKRENTLNSYDINNYTPHER